MGDSGDDDIETLRKKVINNEKTITELKEQLQQLRSENKKLVDGHDKRIRDLEGKKEVLEKENEDFKKRIKELTDEVQYFSTKEGIIDLQKKLQQKDDKINDMKKLFHKEIDEMKKLMQTEMNKLKEDSGKKDIKMENMSKEIRYYSIKANEIENKLAATTKRVEELEESRDRLYLAQMCANIQEYIYRYVLPVYFEQPKPYYQPRVKYINMNIDTLCITDSTKKEAGKKWRDLKTRIGWQQSLEDAMEQFRKERDEVAHPDPLRKDELEKIASRQTGQKQQACKKLIHVWEILINVVEH